MHQFNYLMTLSFLGSNYHGSQIQDNALTVQEVIQNALYDVLSHETDVKFCSRTDAGVHAFMFCISFIHDKELDERTFIARINHLLPEDVRVYSLKSVDIGFHARYSSTGKKYEYYIWSGNVMSPFWQGRAYHVRYPLNIENMKNAAEVLIGTHDFSSFCSIKSSADSKTRTIYDIKVVRKGEHLYIVSIHADGFLYNMARIITGSLLQCSSGKLTAVDIYEYLEGKPRDNRLPTLPAYGLYLKEVYY